MTRAAIILAGLVLACTGAATAEDYPQSPGASADNGVLYTATGVAPGSYEVHFYVYYVGRPYPYDDGELCREPQAGGRFLCFAPAYSLAYYTEPIDHVTVCLADRCATADYD